MLAAAFAICLHRYSGQASLPIDLCRDGELRSLDLAMTGRTVRDVLAQLESSAAAGPASRAAIVWTGAALPERDLQLSIIDDGPRLVYNAKLFERGTIERMAGHLRVLLAGLADPDIEVGDLPLLGETERAWLDEMATGPRRELPNELVHEAIARHARTTPHATAVRYRDQTLTYRELDARANQLAHELIARGAGPERRIAVCVEPSFDIAIALLAILKAGAAYVPIDPGYPIARIRAILDDTQPTLIVSRAHLIERLELSAFATCSLDAPLDHPDSDIGQAVELGSTAYIYYTSGTTGKPKGVMASHANLIAYVDLARARYAIDHRDVMPAIARFSFSISMFELATPLVAGGTLVVLDREHVLDPARLSRTLAEVTFFHAGPSLLKHVLPYIERTYRDPSMFDGVRHASSGGDLIPPELIEALKRIFRRAEVFVIYGCSEIACMGCTYPVARDRTLTKTFVGRPFDNVVVRVLDGARRPVPIGAVGEIHFAGAGVVKGYLNRPELTAERFVEIEGQRFYSTGDMGRVSADGWVEILGRNDFQIKVRGMRIELGEVEFHLRRAPGVRDAVVMAKDTAAGEKVMVGYVVFAEGAAHEMAPIRRHMVDTLPDYMVPATYVELAALPLNHNMKVDRYALPELAAVPAPGRSSGRAPETATERALAAMWREILKLDNDATLDANFFALGADSLIATEMVTRVQTELGFLLDGIDVLRESLEVLAAIGDRQRGIAVAKPARALETSGETFDAFYFADELYGVARGPRTATTAALICAPVGQEHVRAHFVLTKLARELAARGIPSLAFDYYGLGDSGGDTMDATPARWQRDVVAAREELARRTGATRVIGIGVRFGATLLCTAHAGLARVVLWDPCCTGSEFRAEQVTLHARYVRSLGHLRRGAGAKPLTGGEELLGVTYSTAASSELRRLTIPSVSDARWLATFDHARQRARWQELGGRGNFATLDADCAWHDIAHLEDVVPDLGLTRALAAMVEAP